MLTFALKERSSCACGSVATSAIIRRTHMMLHRYLSVFACVVLLLNPGARCDDLKPLFVEGYSAEVSYTAGEEVTFHVSTTAGTFALEVVRIGGTNLTV